MRSAPGRTAALLAAALLSAEPAWAQARALHFGEAVAAAAQEQAAQVAALAYLRAARAQSLASARTADAHIAAELVSLAELQRRAGTAPTIDLTRARTELAAAQGEEIVADHQADRGRLDLARALGLDPGTPLVVADTLDERLGQAPVPAGSAAAIGLCLHRRPELAAERL